MTHRTSWAHERILERESFDGGWIKILYRRSRIPSRRQPCPQRERFSKRSPYQFLPHSCAAQFHLARSLEGGTRVSSLLPPGAPIFLSSTSRLVTRCLLSLNIVHPHLTANHGFAVRRTESVAQSALNRFCTGNVHSQVDKPIVATGA
jgi:hypothetical protein